MPRLGLLLSGLLGCERLEDLEGERFRLRFFLTSSPPALGAGVMEQSILGSLTL